MRKTLVVARREYKAAVGSKAFLVSLVAMPVIMVGSVLAQTVLKDRVDTKDKRIAIVDRTAKIFPSLEAAVALHNEHLWKDTSFGPRQVEPKYVLERVDAAAIGEGPEATLKLSDRVRGETLFAFVEIGPDVIHPTPDEERSATRYYSNSPTNDDARRFLHFALTAIVNDMRFAEAGLSSELVKKATLPTELDNLGLVTRDASGKIVPAEKVNEIVNIFLPFGLMMLLFMSVMVGASPLTQSVMEEKNSRIAEVLLGAVSPFELLLGKLVGTAGVALTIGTVYLAGGYGALSYLGYASVFPAHLVFWFLVFQALTVLMYGSVFIAIGAAVSDMKEAQSTLTPVMLVLCAPMFVWINVLKEPLSPFATAISLVPPATPMLMIMRQAVPPGVPVWQPIAGVVGVTLTTLACVFAASRIFRVGILLQGAGANVATMLKWVVKG